MYFNNGYERKKFENHWATLRVRYATAGMDDAAIRELYRFDLAEFNRNRSEIEHHAKLREVTIYDSVTGESRHMDIDEFPDTSGGGLNFNRRRWIDELHNTALQDAILSLPDEHIEILTLLYEGYTQAEIAGMRGVTPSAMSRLIGRIKEKLYIFLPM